MPMLVWETWKYLASIMDDLAIVCDKVTDAEGKSYDEIKTIPTNFNEKEATCKTQNFYIWLDLY